MVLQRQLSSWKDSYPFPAQLQVAQVTADSGVARTGPSTDYSRLTLYLKGRRLQSRVGGDGA